MARLEANFGFGTLTLHAFHLSRGRIDPRTAAAGGLGRGAAAGGAVAVRGVAAVSKPARRPRHGARLRPRIPGRNRSRAAACVLAGRYWAPGRRQSRLRRLSAGTALLDPHLLGAF